ncbi:senescence-associated carboxylesterase 101 isoform X3 [Morus notabilis]|uniref:senescence-associated carboxylesterase 101 isoform X2 n=1 Tax=Morus notabilis TaxID=981085 RepID=UPI000CECF3AA|nr:senescence-associated carboxylesterase 101 isoform X2 [Morus notabilis]XP_024024303.1 senescence-associated carboxylesterase 101 isoform X3 [Morus notabilis]
MKLFSTGLEQANLLINSNILLLLWNDISELYKDFNNAHDHSSSSLRFNLRYDHQKKFTVITFVTKPDFATHQLLQEGADLVPSSSSIAAESFALFGFLRRKADFAVDRAAITLFDRHRHQLSQLKNEINYSYPIIVTGHSHGGSIASLFTLWLLESVNFSNTKRPICVTFGSPLIGDSNLQKTLFLFSPWNSCFLHVVSKQDPVPRKLINHNANDYKPFGTFLLCSNLGCSCFEEPDTILKLLGTTASEGSDQGGDYGNILETLKRKALFKNVLDADWASSPYAAGIVTQLSAIEQYNLNEDINPLVEWIEKQEMKFLMGKRKVNPDKKLNESKINMAKLEWYKKTSKDKGIGYYDSYKNKSFMSDINVEEIVKRLINYWTDVVEEADKQPQEDGASLRTRWLFAGITYMKMVEPLYIADYYHENSPPDYKSHGRLEHLTRLEQLSAAAKKTNKSISIEKRKNVAHILTEDSCFWAKVEEAINLCKLMKKEEASVEEKKTCDEKLKKFEKDVLVLLKNYSVSPEIFLGGSSFMDWWKGYKDAMGRSYSSELTKFMVSRKYKDYSEGKF